MFHKYTQGEGDLIDDTPVHKTIQECFMVGWILKQLRQGNADVEMLQIAEAFHYMHIVETWGTGI